LTEPAPKALPTRVEVRNLVEALHAGQRERAARGDDAEGFAREVATRVERFTAALAPADAATFREMYREESEAYARRLAESRPTARTGAPVRAALLALLILVVALGVWLAFRG
jgi:hypothetical protein